MSRRLRQLKVPHQISIATSGIPHAFLSMKNLSYETEFAYNKVVSIISSAIHGHLTDMSEKQTTPDFFSEVFNPSE